jgi:hypothetical protein
MVIRATVLVVFSCPGTPQWFEVVIHERMFQTWSDFKQKYEVDVANDWTKICTQRCVLRLAAG